MRKVLLALLLLLATWQASFAQTKNIGIKEGLSNGFVDDMVIDGQGFVWVATEWGLNRIAGNKCSVFTISNSRISNNEHVGLFYHPLSNTIWVHSKDGRADIFDCKTQTFSHFEVDGKVVYSIADICMAADSSIWLADYNGGVHHYNPVTKEYYYIDKKLLPGFGNGVRSITDDGKGNLYIGLRMEGLIIYNTHNKRSRFFKNNPADPNSLPGDNVRSVFIDHLQNIWVGTNKGLALFDPTKGIFRVFKHEKGNPNTLAGDNIMQVTETSDNTLWIASDIGGISKLDLNKFNHPNTGEVAFTQLTRENYALSSNNTRRVLQDAYGNMWVANYSTGVDFIPSSTTSFMTLNFMGDPIVNVSALFCDSKDNLWIGQDNKISQYRQGTIVHQWDFSQYISNSSSSVYLFREDPQGNIWFGTADNGVLMLNPTTGAFTRFDSTKDLDVNALYIDKDGKVWAGTEDGVYTIYNKVETKEKGINDIMGQSAIPFSIIEDDYGQIWIGTLARGIYIFDKNKKLVTHLGLENSYPSNSINQLIKDEDGGIWAATHSGLVYIPNPKDTKNFKVYGEEQGISDNHIRSLVQDRQGNIWVSMFSGIACFDRNKEKFYNYDYQSGIPTGNFGVGSAVISSTGIVYFGSPGGICTFNPQLLTDQKDMPIVEIIDCEQIMNTTEKLQRSIVIQDNNGVAHLKYDENTFKITFTSGNFAQEGNVEYSYLMKGLDDKWYETEGDNEVTFRNLSPGEYTFQVRAKLKNQEWENAKVAEMKVVVEPPLWLTWWAKLIYALIVGSIIFYFVRSYTNELKLRSSLEKTKWEAQQKQELNEERLRFFTNITHELRTPLTLIMGPLEDLMADTRLPEVLAKKVKNIHASSVRLLNLINEILEFRKTETQNRRLTVAHSDIKSFVKEIGDRFKDLNRNPQVTFNVNMPEQQAVDIYFDSEIISTVLNNLISNAIKYTPKGNIDITLSCINGKTNTTERADGLQKVVISVKDTGYGISKKALPHIYDRYYQAKGLHQASGTGIGLALVQSLAKLHEAELTVESEEGKGTEFCFILDANNTYPNALHKEDAPIEENIANMGMSDASILDEKDSDDTPDSLEGNEEKEQTDVRPLLLIVEDNDDIRQYINESLCEDYRVIEARNGKEGRDLAFNQIPDLIVSDIMMPEMDGIEMMKILKNDIRTSHIPIILLTAKTTPIDQEVGYDSGADSYLMKPFSASLLHSRIRNILSGRRRLAEFIIQHSLSGANASLDINQSGNGNLNANVVDGAERNDVRDVTGNINDNIDTSVPELSPLDKKFIEKLNRLIEENMTTIDIDIAFMTDKMAMSHSSFYRKVKALTGVSANEYIRKVKLQRSMQLLKEGESNVTEVAMLTGFNNIGYFRKCFKKEFGISPSDVLKGKG
mgnify:FL=1